MPCGGSCDASEADCVITSGVHGGNGKLRGQIISLQEELDWQCY